MKNQADRAIVCGVDFSEGSRKAVDVAAALGRRLEAAQLWLVHVLDSSTSALHREAYETLKAAAQKRLAEEAQRLTDTGANVQYQVVEGSVTEELLRFAEATKARLLIVASQGHSPSSIVRVGGTSERLAQLAQVPVLVVRDGAPFEAWAQGTRPLRVLLAVDWTRSCDAAIRWVKALGELGPVDLVVGHIYYSDSSRDGAGRYGLQSQHSMFEPNSEAEGLLLRDLAARVGDFAGQGKLTIRPKHGVGRLGDHLLELADEENIDLIAMGNNRRSGLARLGSAAAVTLHHSRASVALVPMKEGELSPPEVIPRLRRILVPTDLSPLSNFGVPFGYTLLGDSGGEVYLLHVLGPDTGEPSAVETAAQLQALVPQGVAANVTTRAEVVHHSNVALAICEAAERRGIDAICLSSHGRSGVKRAVLGSVADTVMRESSRPVFIVRPLRG